MNCLLCTHQLIETIVGQFICPTTSLNKTHCRFRPYSNVYDVILNKDQYKIDIENNWVEENNRLITSLNGYKFSTIQQLIDKLKIISVFG